MRKQPIAVCGISFKDKSALTRYVREIVESYKCGEMMAEPHARFLFDLILSRHNEPDKKLIPGMIGQVVGIKVLHEAGCPKYGKSRTNRNHCRVVYSSGEEIDFSWKKCCEGSFSVERDADHALRGAAEPHVREFKKQRFVGVGATPHCEATGVPLTWDSCQVDHYPLTWVALRDRFLVAESLILGDIKTEAVVPEGGCRLADKDLEARFQQFHNAEATLRLVSIEVNARSWRDAAAIRK